MLAFRDARFLRRYHGVRRALRAAVGGLGALCIAGAASAQERVEVASPEELLQFFESLGYTPEAWQAGIREVPRATCRTAHGTKRHCDVVIASVCF